MYSGMENVTCYSPSGFYIISMTSGIDWIDIKPALIVAAVRCYNQGGLQQMRRYLVALYSAVMFQ